jgi:transcriptional regulator with GAF, ATPase, and Fis domain
LDEVAAFYHPTRGVSSDGRFTPGEGRMDKAPENACGPRPFHIRIPATVHFERQTENVKKQRPSRLPRLSHILAPKASRDLEREWHQLVRLQEINQWLNSELDSARLLERIMDIVIDLTKAERGFLILNRHGADEIMVARNIDREEVRRPEFKISHSIAAKVRATGEPILTNDAMTEAGVSASSSVSDLRLKSVVCIPFKVKERIIGTLYLDHRFEKGKFSSEDLSVLEAFGHQAAIALENARLLEEAQEARSALEKANLQLEGRLRSSEEEIEALRRESEAPGEPLRHDYGRLIGRSPAMRRLSRLLDRVTDTLLPVVLLGESGTGKELVARIIHDNGPRRGAPFVSINCGAMPASLLESELFGHVKGAFTGAIRDKLGLFEVAHKGTLFLDEVVEMEPAMQAKLLRALENGEIRPVGAIENRRVDVRILSATNRDLEGSVGSGRFRADLYYRMKGFEVEVPPLRERAGDIALLVEFFLDRLATESGARRKTITPAAVRLLERYSWPGNVRELQNEVRRLAALSGDVLDEALVHREFSSRTAARDSLPSLQGRTLAEIEKRAIEDALAVANGRRIDAARALGISRRTLYDKMKRYRIPSHAPRSSDGSPPAKTAQ